MEIQTTPQYTIPTSATATGAAPDITSAAAPTPAPDAFLLQKEQAEDQQARELSEKLEALKGQIAAGTKKADKLNKIVGGPLFYAFCASTLGVIVGGAFGIAPLMLGIVATEGALIAILRHRENKIEKSMAPLVQEAYTTQQQIEAREKTAADIKDLRDMNRATESDDTRVDDDDNFVFIDGMKLRKQSHETMDMLRVVFRD